MGLQELDEMAVDASASKIEYHETPMFKPMESFRPLTEVEARKLIAATPKKSCALDPIQAYTYHCRLY